MILIPKKVSTTLCCLIFSLIPLWPQEDETEIHNVLFINSYSMTYSWTDSILSGIQSVFSARNDIQMYIEFIDAKRFNELEFDELYRLYKKKYRNIDFDAAITSDNDALDFMMQYSDSLVPSVPIIFCGINNPADYQFEGTNFYGILDGIDLKAEIDLIVQVMPSVRKLYFISDSLTTTSLINLNTIRRIESSYTGRIDFQYICKYPLDSLLQTVRNFEPGSAIALINYYQDPKGNPVNPEAVNLLVIRNSKVPIFMESETLLGKGIAGGIFIKGRTHGQDAANLTLRFIDEPGFVPPTRVTQPKNKYYFDYKILKKFMLPRANLPEGSIIINKPYAAFVKIMKYIIPLLAIIAFLLVALMILWFNTRRRKKAEELVALKLNEIKEKNAQVEHAHSQVTEMNSELELINDHLLKTNEELTKAKERSEESDRLKSAFLANMSHEIRTPLNAIIGFSSLLNDPLMSHENREHYFRIINTNSSQLLNIIEDILDLSKIEAGQLKIAYEEFSVNELVSLLAESFKQNLNQNQVNINIAAFTSQHQIRLISDPVRFKQIISNLITNAVKFTHKGTIDVGYRLDNDKFITFFVKDTGVGINKEDLPNIFDRFWKAEDKAEKFQSGTGLGLSICSKLCAALGGKIWADSTPGIGSVFYFTLPHYVITSGDAQVSAALTDNPQYFNLSGFTVAIVEDEKSNSQLLAGILKKLKIKSVNFDNGSEIVAYLNNPSEKIDLILMDIKMPVMNGFMATKLIRERYPDIPIIAQTAYAMVDDIEKIKQSSFNDYIVKPIKPPVLAEKIRKLLIP